LYFLEFGFCRGIARVSVRVELARFFAKCSFDLDIAGISTYAQNRIGVLLRH
jgi:hypothetical protein